MIGERPAALGVGIFALLAATLGAVAITRGRTRRHPAQPLPSQPTYGRSQPQPSQPTQGSPVVSPGNFTAQYTPQFWAMQLAPLAAAQHIPLAFVTAAITEESQGNPCAIGNPEQYGKDGNPREIGPYQLYNAPDGSSDDFTYLKISPVAMRVYCNPNKVPYTTRDGRHIMGPSQQVIRPLTDAEVAEVAAAIIGKVGQSRTYAAHYAIESKLAWPSDGVDFWRLVKLVHGLPGLVNTGIHNVTAFLGRPPVSWAEYRHCIQSGQVHCDPNTEKYRGSDGFASTFDNAEKATATMQGAAVS